METQKSKSSIVAMNVESFPSALTSVSTLLPLLAVFMDNPVGVLKLSGETALAMASAVFASPYSSVIVASNFLALQLLCHQLVDGFYEVFNLVYRHLSACSHVVSAAFSAVLL